MKHVDQLERGSPGHELQGAVSDLMYQLRIPDLPPSRPSSLHMRLGRALACVDGDQREAREALDRALGTSGLSPFAEAALGGDVAIGPSRLGHYAQADRLLREAAEAMARWSPLFRAQFLGRQTQTAVRADKPALAVHHMHSLTRALPFVSSPLVDTRVTEILTATAKWDRIPDVRTAREHLRSMLPAESSSA
ncbi:hypothetical protein [Nonomuraea sp. NPDC049607]|uniref:hypothetical protein n=1 Tax=Nonomuraea sp. NPDC049607 TaxID=3154732 RepID=UPI00341ECC93